MVSETGNGVRVGDIPGPHDQLAFPAFSQARGGSMASATEYHAQSLFEREKPVTN